jgi:hypothetical protein
MRSLQIIVTAAMIAAMGAAVEPNILVSHDIPLGHTESDVAVNPRDPNNLLGATTVFAGTDGALYNKTYMSRDGGYTWIETTPEQTRRDATGDPRAIFTNRGTALFVTLNLTGHSSDVYRSTNGGDTWGGVTHFKLFDHELVAVDRTNGRFSNRVYIAGEGIVKTKEPPSVNPMGGIRYIYLYTSDNDGRSFTLHATPESGLLGKGQPFDRGGVGVEGVNVLSDGTLVLAFARYEAGEAGIERDYVATSRDGGKTWTKPVAVADFFVYPPGGRAAYLEQNKKKMNLGDASDQGSLTVIAADTSSGPYKDRLYLAWPNRRSGNGRITYRYSADRGRTWSAPKTMGTLDAGEAQFMPEVATNGHGAVAIAWYSTAGFPKRDHFDAYAAISTDGGATFSAPVRVSSEASMPHSPGNLYPVPLNLPPYGIAFISAYSRWAAGGDYIGLAAGNDGVFHLYWPDSRGDTYQIYSARIHAEEPSPVPDSVASHDVTKDITLITDPLGFNPAVNEIDIPLRLKNVSQHPIYGPIMVEFQGLQNAMMKAYGHTAPSAEILNAGNSKPGAGATFDYSHALGSFGVLPPGGVTEAVLWRFRISDITNLAPMTLNVKVTARY